MPNRSTTTTRRSNASATRGRIPARRAGAKKAARTQRPSKASTTTRSRRTHRAPTSVWLQDGIGAIDLLKADHDKVRALLKALEETEDGDERGSLFDQVRVALQVHSKLEEEIFYPAFKEACTDEEDRGMFYEAREEHDSVDILIAKLEAGEPDSEVYAAQCKVLKEQVEHHADEEEEDMFPRARRLLGAKEMKEIGRRMQERRPALFDLYQSNPGGEQFTEVEGWTEIEETHDA